MDFPEGSELNLSCKGPTKGAKMTVMYILRFMWGSGKGSSGKSLSKGESLYLPKKINLIP